MSPYFRAWLVRLFGEEGAAEALREHEAHLRSMEIPLIGPHYTRSQAEMDEHHAPPVSAEVEAFVKSTERRPK